MWTSFGIILKKILIMGKRRKLNLIIITTSFFTPLLNVNMVIRLHTNIITYRYDYFFKASIACVIYLSGIYFSNAVLTISDLSIFSKKAIWLTASIYSSEI